MKDDKSVNDEKKEELEEKERQDLIRTAISNTMMVITTL